MRLQAALGEWQPDIVHAHAAIPGVVARLAGAAGRSSAPVVHTMHGWGTAKTAAQATADLAVLQLADAIVTPSQASRQALLDLGLSARRAGHSVWHRRPVGGWPAGR